MKAVDGIATFTGLSFSASGSYQVQVKSGTVAPATVGPILVMLPVTVPPRAPNSPATVVAPVVLSEQLVTAGKGKNKYVTGIVITFSTALDPTTAQNASNYTVIQTTKGGRASVAKAIRLHARYKLANKTVKLTFARETSVRLRRSAYLECRQPGRTCQPCWRATRGKYGHRSRLGRHVQDPAEWARDGQLIRVRDSHARGDGPFQLLALRYDRSAC